MIFPYKLGPPIGSRSQIGMIVLQSDETLEYEFRQMLPSVGVALYVTRVPSSLTVSASTLFEMRENLPASSRLLPSRITYDIVGYGCTSGASIIGSSEVSRLIDSSCCTRLVTDPVLALRMACCHLGITRLAFLSPYIEEVSVHLRGTLRDFGILTDCFASFNESDESRVAHISSSSIFDAAVSLYRSSSHPPDAIFISCTNLQTLSIISDLSIACGCPVLSSNLVLGWHIMHSLGLSSSHPGLSCFALGSDIESKTISAN